MEKRKKLTLSFIENLMFEAPSSHLHMVKRGGSTILTRETRVAPSQNNNNKVLAISYLRCETTTRVAPTRNNNNKVLAISYLRCETTTRVAPTRNNNNKVLAT